MKIFVKAKPNAKNPKITQLGPNTYEVAVSEQPIEGRANRAIVEALAEHFNVAKSLVRIHQGNTGRYKIFEIIGLDK